MNCTAIESIHNCHDLCLAKGLIILPFICDYLFIQKVLVVVLASHRKWDTVSFGKSLWSNKEDKHEQIMASESTFDSEVNLGKVSIHGVHKSKLFYLLRVFTAGQH